MPVILAIVIASVQNSTFELVNENKIPVLLLNRDTSEPAKALEAALMEVGMFDIKKAPDIQNEEALKDRINTKDALVAIVIPAHYSEDVLKKAKNIASEALKNIALPQDSVQAPPHEATPVQLYYHPVLQQSFRKSIDGMLRSSLQFIQTKYIVKEVYQAVNEEEIPLALEDQIVTNQTPVAEVPVLKNNTRQIPNATQHNVPAWTIFAMFFIVISLGSSIVREKLNGSIIRLRTLPTHFGLAIISKQITYVAVTILQAIVIFSIGVWLFPKMGLPALNLPSDITALLLVTFICGWCAASFAICIGVFSNTQEQANGFGAVSVVLLAAIGGLLVPSFVMPPSFQLIMRLSPLHWCLEAYYGLFLEGGKLQDIIMNIIPLLVITLLLQIIAFYGLRHKRLI
jgi:ABC-2 type transport system permease protein